MNYRDIAGHVTRSGAIVQPRRLIRSDAIIAPEPAELALLAGDGIKLVYDLRSAHERAAIPLDYWPAVGASVRGVDLFAHLKGAASPWAALEAQPDATGANTAMHVLYGSFPAALHGQLQPIVDGILSSGGATLIHCTAGKDRTGFLVATLLQAVGVSDDAVMADYLASLGRTNVAARRATAGFMADRLGTTLPDAAVDCLMTVRASFLETSLAAIRAEFGGMEAYLASAGITPDRMNALEALLTG
jgi:protein-tyrosine phosphatase